MCILRNKIENGQAINLYDWYVTPYHQRDLLDADSSILLNIDD